MALEDGVSVFILISDDPDVLERFAAETIPAVREHVTRGRKIAPVSPSACSPCRCRPA
jgi:hypothetical protein